MKNYRIFFAVTSALVSGLLLVVIMTFTGCAGRTYTQTAVQTNAGFDLAKGTVTLNNGVEMPVLGLGTFRLSVEQTELSVYSALTSGYRLIDTANAYMNERAVGRAIRRSGIPREDVFITTKLWPSVYANAAQAIDDTLARLDVEYIDLLLLHQAYGNYIAAWQAMEKAVAEGKVRSIGLSNFYQNRFNEIVAIATIPPAVLQNEQNPYFLQNEMREHIKPYGTVLMNWFPLGGRSERQVSLFEDETILEIARSHGKSAAQIILRWHIQSDGIAIPGSSNPAHILENITIFDFELTEEEMRRINALNTGIPAFVFSEVDDDPRFQSFTAPMDFNAQR